MLNYQLLKKALFKFEPETAHNIAEFTFKNAPQFIQNSLEKSYSIESEALTQNLFGATFKNPVGIGAGFDKNATMIETLSSLGFGSLEIGTVTPKPQAGNSKPRLFRYPEQESIQNAMGFNNDGLKVIKDRVQKLYPYKIPIGVNIGKNKVTSEEMAIEDYRVLIENFRDICDYLVINISSPNTPNLRDLQNEEFIKELFRVGKSLTQKPILLKIAPDIEFEQARNLTSFAVESGADGIVATNTTIDYSLLNGAKDFGGISGRVLKEKSFELFRAIAKEFYGKTTLISVGGVDSADEAYRRIKSGASLIQIYSSFIFQGPKLVKDINLGLIDMLNRDGFKNIEEAVGSDL